MRWGDGECITTGDEPGEVILFADKQQPAAGKHLQATEHYDLYHEFSLPSRSGGQVHLTRREGVRLRR